MIKITEQEFAKRYDALPEGLRETFLSEENINMILKIGEVHHLSEERIRKIAGVIGYIVLGVVHIEDLAKEIAVEADVDRRLAGELAQEIQVKILNPIIPQLQQLYHYGSTGTATPPAGTVAAPAPPPQPAIMKPVFAPPPSEARNQRPETGRESPFILHEGQKDPPAGGEQARSRNETLVRPSFYDPSAGSTGSLQAGRGQAGRETINRPAAARLEIGGIEEAHPPAGGKEPQVGKTEEPPIRVVHYSGPQTPVDPFGSQAPDNGRPPREAEKRKAEPPRDIHPENIVDLKDLPK